MADNNKIKKKTKNLMNRAQSGETYVKYIQINERTNGSIY